MYKLLHFEILIFIRFHLIIYNDYGSIELNELQWTSVALETPMINDNVGHNHLRVSVDNTIIEVYPGFDEYTFESIVKNPITMINSGLDHVYSL